MENSSVPNNSDAPSGDESFTASLGEYLSRTSNFDPPKKDQLIAGRVSAISDRQILIELGAKSEGIVYGKEIEALPKDVRNSLKIGDEVYAYVITPEDRNGNVVLSLAKAITEKDWRGAEELFQKQEAVEAMVAGFNKGGVIIKVGRLRGFVPASQLSLAHQRMMGDETLPPEQRFQKLVGQKALIKVIEIDRERNRLILSERAASKEAREALKTKLLAEIEIGATVEGIVSSVKEFGAFVDLGGADGMIHLSEMSYQRVKHPNELLKEGQKVKVKVIGLERDNGEPEPRDSNGKQVEVHPVHAVQGLLHSGLGVHPGGLLVPAVEQAGEHAEQEVSRPAGRVDPLEPLQRPIVQGRFHRPVQDELLDEHRGLQQRERLPGVHGQVLVEVAEEPGGQFGVAQVVRRGAVLAAATPELQQSGDGVPAR